MNALIVKEQREELIRLKKQRDRVPVNIPLYLWINMVRLLLHITTKLVQKKYYFSYSIHIRDKENTIPGNRNSTPMSTFFNIYNAYRKKLCDDYNKNLNK